MSDREIERKLAAIESALVTLIAWIAQSSVGVISTSEAQKLLRIIEGKEEEQNAKGNEGS